MSELNDRLEELSSAKRLVLMLETEVERLEKLPKFDFSHPELKYLSGVATKYANECLAEGYLQGESVLLHKKIFPYIFSVVPDQPLTLFGVRFDWLRDITLFVNPGTNETTVSP